MNKKPPIQIRVPAETLQQFNPEQIRACIINLIQRKQKN